MSGAIEPVDWHHSADELHERYRVERTTWRRVSGSELCGW